jgi:response regulator NasT
MRELRQEVDTLKDKIETRKLVEKAKGILMTRFDIPEQVAYRKLQKEAMDKRMSLKEMAQILLETLATS